jgi:RNA polymerase sigma-70 factor (ECF subfamily)
MGDDKLNDEQLMARVCKGDTAAYEVLYDRYSPVVMGFALKITGDYALAEEIVQETFWRVWQKAESFEVRRGAFTGWFFSIARNLSIDLLRRRRMQAPSSDDTEQRIEQAVDPQADVAEIAWSGVRHQQVRSAIETLPPEQRRVIEMAFFRGMTRQEIAQAIGEPLGTVHTRARLALQKLHEALQTQGFED